MLTEKRIKKGKVTAYIGGVKVVNNYKFTNTNKNGSLEEGYIFYNKKKSVLYIPPGSAIVIKKQK